jgi:nucleoside-diphosphate-sugar epimerase
MKLLITGATGLTGSLLLHHLAQTNPGSEIDCLVRENSDRSYIENLNLKLNYHLGNSESYATWQQIFTTHTPETIIHIASIRHIDVILQSLQKFEQNPRLIVIGTTGVYSQYNEYSGIYKKMESLLRQYRGSYCLLRPTMIYGSYRDKNIHKLIKFCDRYGFFWIFGAGNSFLQPIHAEDLAQALLSILQNPELQGEYNVSGGSIVDFRELLKIIEKQLGKTIHPISFPFQLGVWSSSLLEAILQEYSPVRKEQILRLQEDKAYPHDAAKKDFNFNPRSLEVGIQQEVEQMRRKKII